MKLTKIRARKLERLYRERVEWIKKNIKESTASHHSCNYCDEVPDIRNQPECYPCPAFDHNNNEACCENALDLTRGRVGYNIASAKTHLKTTYRLFRQWRKRYGHLLEK